jgi:hypothetical protein
MGIATVRIPFENFKISWLEQEVELPKLYPKETVQRDFLTPVFVTKRLILVSIDMPKSDFEIVKFSRSYLYLNYQKIDSPLSIKAGSLKQSLR